MNLSVPKPIATSESNPVVSTYSILLLSGMLFGMCVSGNFPNEIKFWVVVAGMLGLVAYLMTSLAARAQRQTQQRIAAQQVEERLDRHSHFDLRSEDLRLDQAMAATKAV